MRKSGFNGEFCKLLYDLIEFEQVATVPWICSELKRRFGVNIAASTFYKYILGEITCPADVIRALCHIMPDERFIRFFVPESLALVRLPDPNSNPHMDIITEIADILQRAGEVASRAAESISEASEGGANISHIEADDIKRRARTLEQELEALINLIDRSSNGSLSSC